MVSYLDLFLLIPIGLAIWRGWRNGFVMEVFSMLALFVGLYAGVHLSDWMANFLRTKFDMSSESLPIVSFVVVLVLVFVGLYFMGKLITQTVSAGGAERWNQVGGAFFSLTKTLEESEFFKNLEAQQLAPILVAQEEQEKAEEK